VDVSGLVELWRQPTWRRFVVAAFLARLPMTMQLIALVLAGERATGSLAVGAQLAGVATILAGLAAPWRGRHLDAREVRRGLQLASASSGVVLLGLAAAVVASVPVAVLFAIAAVQGVVMAPVSGGYRALLPAVVARTDLYRANSIEAVNIEVAFVTGPALAGTLALAVGPVGVLVVMAGFAFSSVLVAAALPAVRRADGPLGEAPWRAPGVLGVYGIALSLGLAVGLFESAVPPRAVELGYTAASAGPLLALLAAGSGVGGVIATLRNDGAERVRLQAFLLLAAFGVLILPAAAAGSVVLLGLALFVAGIPIAPLNALGAMLLHQDIPVGRQAEGFAAYTAAIVIGIGAGQFATGLALDLVGAQAVLFACAVIPLALALVVARRARRGRGPVKGSEESLP
jgi:MFS family permease